ncbi:MAG: hypothetical protein RIT26_1955 [Pseudomonadota bacterium]
MSASTPYDFSALVPGFDFLNKLATAPGAAAPSVSSWVAPTLDPKELEKRIQDLRTVKFWLEQNTQAVDATIKALEVQRMTLATLQGMNVSMGQLAEALKVPAAPQGAGAATGVAAGAAAGAGEKAPAKKRRTSAAGQAGAGQGKESGAPVDPMAWWGALTQQFQQIAGDAMQDMQRKAQAQPGAGGPSAAAPAKGKARTAGATRRGTGSRRKKAP